jgi:cephalosporin hydroxylase
MGLPEPIGRDLDETVADYWRRRLAAGAPGSDSWAGVPLLKLPEDLRVYQHLLWESRADTVIELGAKWGGSLLWFRDQLRTFAGYGRLERDPAVIGVDLITAPAGIVLDRAEPAWREQIALVQGDVTAEETISRVRSELRPGARCLVVEDAAHTAEVTRAALDGFAELVPPGGFYVVEDGHVDLERLHPEGPPELTQLGITTGGVQRAISEWLQTPTGRGFTRRQDLELYGITSNPGGYLQRDGASGSE